MNDVAGFEGSSRNQEKFLSEKEVVLVKQSPRPEKSLRQENHIEGDGSGSSTRILVIDDNEPFRRFVRTTLSRRPELQIVGEASDGLEGIQKAVDLQPALIVLDIGLPSLNGLEAARRIRKLSPDSTILFLSQESSADVVEEAFCLGARGFVVKVHAARDLLVGVEAVLRKESFVSCQLKAVDSQR